MAQLIYAVSAAFAVYAAVMAWRRRRAVGARWIVPLTLHGVWWMGTSVMFHSSMSYEARMVWAVLSSVGAFQGPIWFLFALERSIPGYRAPRWLAWPLLAWGFICVAAAVTNDLHHLFWRSAEYVRETGIIVFRFNYIYHAAVIVLCTLFATASLLLVVSLFRTWGMYRAQNGVLLVAIVLQLMTYADLLLGGVWPPGLYPNMANGFALGMVAFLFTYLRFTELVPVGRHEMVSSMPDGFVVTDLDGRIADANPAARALFPAEEGDEILGRLLEEVFAGWEGFDGMPARMACGDGITRMTGPDGTVVDARYWCVRNASGERIGDAVLLRDVTAVLHAQDRVGDATRSVTAWVDEMDRMGDLLGESGRRS